MVNVLTRNVAGILNSFAHVNQAGFYAAQTSDCRRSFVYSSYFMVLRFPSK
jgi:hypothetical protein